VVCGHEFGPVGRLRRRTVERFAARLHEPERPIVQRLNDYLPFVDEPVVEAAQGDEVREFGLPAIDPVLHVVAVDVALERAAGEATAVIACLQRPADAGRDGPGLSPDIQRLTLRVLDDPHHAAVTGETPRGLRSDRRAVF